jgi:hypothetical protein
LEVVGLELCPASKKDTTQNLIKFRRNFQGKKRKEKERNFQGKKLPTSSKEVRRKFSVPTEATASINTTSKLTASTQPPNSP